MPPLPFPLEPDQSAEKSDVQRLMKGERPSLYMKPVKIGSKADLPADYVDRMPPMEPVSGEEVGVEKKQAKVYKKKFSSGGYTKAADGIAKRGKTKGRFV